MSDVGRSQIRKLRKRYKSRYKLWNVVWNWHNPELKPESLRDLMVEDEDIRYFIFKPEKGETQEKGYHYQGYLELNRRLSFSSFRKRYPFSDIQPRRGSRAQALGYVTKKETTAGSIYEEGTPRRDYQLYRRSNLDIPELVKEQWIYIAEEIKNYHYQSLEDVERDFPYLVIHHWKVIERLINQANPIKVLSQSPLRVIWLFGESGSGKTVWTQHYLSTHGYSDSQITRKKTSNELNPKLWFNLEDRNRKVLWIEEVREDFPHYNDLIKFIDRSDWLEVKGSMIRNNYELLICNSLLPPEEIYSKRSVLHREEILRRIFEGLPSNKVFKVSLDDSRLSSAKADKRPLPFWMKYQPQVEEYKRAWKVLARS